MGYLTCAVQGEQQRNKNRKCWKHSGGRAVSVEKVTKLRLQVQDNSFTEKWMDMCSSESSEPLQDWLWWKRCGSGFNNKWKLKEAADVWHLKQKNPKMLETLSRSVSICGKWNSSRFRSGIFHDSEKNRTRVQWQYKAVPYHITILPEYVHSTRLLRFSIYTGFLVFVKLLKSRFSLV